MSFTPRGPRPDASPTKWLQLNIDVAGVAPDTVEELERRLNESRDRLVSEVLGTDGARRATVKRI